MGRDEIKAHTAPRDYKAEIKRFPPFSFVVHFLFVPLQLHSAKSARHIAR